jgi:signal transduction histidine kinase
MRRAGSTTGMAAAIAAAVAVSLAGAAAGIWAASADGQSVGAAIALAVFIAAFAAVGAVVTAARPANAVGWVMLAGVALSSAGNAGAVIAHHGIVTAPGSVPAVSAFAVAGQSCRSLGWYVLTLALPLIFPAGSLPRPGWRWLRVLLYAVLVACVVGPVTDKQADLTGLGSWRNPIGLHGVAQIVSGIAFVVQAPLGLVVAGGAVAVLVSRWRRGNALLRQQLLLFVVAAAIPIVAVPIVFATGFTDGPWVFSLTVIPLPIAIGFAVLARGLYDLRTAANRTLVWVTLSGVVAGIYALAIAGLGNQLGARDAHWLPWVAAGVTAVSFAPLRDALQRAVNRLTFGRWDQPYDVLAGLGQQLEDSADVNRLLVRVVEELHGLDLTDVAICDPADAVVAGDGGLGGLDTLPLTAYGHRVGTLHFTQPAGGLRSRDRQLLDNLAGHLGGVLHAHALTAELQQARERLVLAREEERRRLRRDLHDGLGPALAGHLLRLDVIAARVGGRSAAAAEIDNLRDDVRTTVSEVRRVVEGLRPPALDELGLVGALEQATSRLAGGTSVVVSVEAGDLPELSAALEVATYRIVTEAVTNVVKHAHATRCVVALTADHGMLRISVTDDGVGLPDRRSRAGGHGLHTMRERAEELRGRLRVSSASPGTTVVAELPVPPAQRRRETSRAAVTVE